MMTTPIYPNEEIRIDKDSQVTLHFEVLTQNGVVIDSTFDKDTPVSFVVGDGSLLEGFEKVLMGLKAGDTRTAHLSPQEAFGEHNEQNIQTFLPAQFALTANPQTGMMVEFADKGGNAVVGIICHVDDDKIMVDFNHPLAGQSILFKVQIFKVIPKGQSALQLV